MSSIDEPGPGHWVEPLHRDARFFPKLAGSAHSYGLHCPCPSRASSTARKTLKTSFGKAPLALVADDQRHQRDQMAPNIPPRDRFYSLSSPLLPPSERHHTTGSFSSDAGGHWVPRIGAESRGGGGGRAPGAEPRKRNA